MGFKKVCRTAWAIFVVTVRGFWLITVLLIIFPPVFTFYAHKRFYLRRKVKRRLMSNGMPPEVASKYAWKYSDFLVDYGSLRGLFRITKVTRKKDKELDEENNSLEIEKAKSYSFAL